jgi:hypothetical protein
VARKKRKRKISVYIAIEGKREKEFFDFLKGIYKPEDHDIAITGEEPKGGSSDAILLKAIKKQDYKRSIAWFDEDVPLTSQSAIELANCWNVEEEKVLACPSKELQSKFNSANKRKPTVVVW